MTLVVTEIKLQYNRGQQRGFKMNTQEKVIPGNSTCHCIVKHVATQQDVDEKMQRINYCLSINDAQGVFLNMLQMMPCETRKEGM